MLTAHILGDQETQMRQEVVPYEPEGLPPGDDTPQMLYDAHLKGSGDEALYKHPLLSPRLRLPKLLQFPQIASPAGDQIFERTSLWETLHACPLLGRLLVHPIYVTKNWLQVRTEAKPRQGHMA